MTTLEQIEEYLSEAARLLADELGDGGDDALQLVRRAIRAVENVPACTDEWAERGNAAVIALRQKGLL